MYLNPKTMSGKEGFTYHAYDNLIKVRIVIDDSAHRTRRFAIMHGPSIETEFNPIDPTDFHPVCGISP